MQLSEGIKNNKIIEINSGSISRLNKSINVFTHNDYKERILKSYKQVVLIKYLTSIENILT